MKRYAKWGGVLLLTPVLLFVFLSLLFYFPPFQRWAVRQAAAYASGKTGMQISVGSVRLSFPLDLALADVRAFAPNDTQPDCRDTVALVGPFHPCRPHSRPGGPSRPPGPRHRPQP